MVATLRSFQGHIRDYQVQRGKYAKCSAEGGKCDVHMTRANRAKGKAKAVAQKLLEKGKIPSSVIRSGLKQLVGPAGASVSSGGGTTLDRSGSSSASASYPESDTFQPSDGTELDRSGGSPLVPILGGVVVLSLLGAAAWKLS